jgi:hypothetical protein
MHAAAKPGVGNFPLPCRRISDLQLSTTLIGRSVPSRVLQNVLRWESEHRKLSDNPLEASRSGSGRPRSPGPVVAQASGGHAFEFFSTMMFVPAVSARTFMPERLSVGTRELAKLGAACRARHRVCSTSGPCGEGAPCLRRKDEAGQVVYAGRDSAMANGRPGGGEHASTP